MASSSHKPVIRQGYEQAYHLFPWQSTMKTTGKTFKFNSPLNWEHSSGLVVSISQHTESTFELFTKCGDIPHTGYGQVEWTYTTDSQQPSVEQIGIWWTNNQLDEYDGVFELPKQAVEFIQSLGIQVGPDFLD